MPGSHKTLRTLAIAAFGLGAVLRAVYVFLAHPAIAYDFSDMHGYIEHAQRILGPRAEGIFDTFHPPGAAYLFGLLFKLDPSWHAAYAVQWAMSAAVMLFAWDIARRLYDDATASITLIIAALHYPLTHYAGFFLAENGCVFFTALCFWTLVIAWQATTLRTQLIASAFAGMAFGLGTAFKNSMLGPGALLAIGMAVMARLHKRRGGWRIGVMVAVSAALSIVPLAARCTRLHEGVFCLAAANSGANILIGHNGDAGMFYWHDHERHIEMAIGSPDAGMRGYERPVHLQFGGYDDARNLEVAKAWVKAHPGEALWLSIRNVFDLFAMPTLWPGAVAFGVDWGAVSQRLFWLMVLPQAALALGCAFARREDTEAALLLLLPLLGVMATVFISVSEVRYRIPFDVFIIVLCARGWTRLGPLWRLLDRRTATTL